MVAFEKVFLIMGVDLRRWPCPSCCCSGPGGSAEERRALAAARRVEPVSTHRPSPASIFPA